MGLGDLFKAATDVGKAVDEKNKNKASALQVSSASQFENADDVLAYLRQKAPKDATSRDTLFSYLLSEKSAQSARQWEVEQNSKRYQTMVDDLKKAGINPYWLNSLGGAATYQGSSNKYSSGYETAQRDENTANKNLAGNLISGVGTVLSFLGTALMIMAML